MIIGKVVGTVVGSINRIGIDGAVCLLVEKCNQQGVGQNDFLVALDLVGAGNEEMVMIAESSAARETPMTFNKAVDAVIVGIIDLIDENEQTIYRK